MARLWYTPRSDELNDLLSDGVLTAFRLAFQHQTGYPVTAADIAEMNRLRGQILELAAQEDELRGDGKRTIYCGCKHQLGRATLHVSG